MPRWKRLDISTIWGFVLNLFEYIRVDLAWRLGSGGKVRIGMDAWFGSGNFHILPPRLIQFLEASDIRTLEQTTDPENSTTFCQSWKFAHKLRIRVH